MKVFIIGRALLLLMLLLPPMATAGARPLPPKPVIHSRKEWRAELPSHRIPFDRVKTRVVVHHTAYFVTDAVKALGPKASWEAAVQHAHAAQFLHEHIHGWNDVGYHYMIDWEGRILEGRPVDRLGAHTERNNTGSIGVVLMGDFSRQRPTAKQLDSLEKLLRWLLAAHHISAKNIFGHHHLKYTDCPGKYLNNPWDSHSPLHEIQIKLLVEQLNA